MRTWLSLLLLSPVLCAAARPERIAGEWIVTRDPAGPSWSRLLRGPVESFGPEGRYALVRGERPSGEGILAVQPNYLYRASEDDPDFGKSWGLENRGQTLSDGTSGVAGVDIGAPEAWKIHDGDGRVIVAILDSGVDRNHEELQGGIWRNEREIASNGVDDDGNGFVDDIEGWNFVSGSADVSDDNDHGTFCAGIVAARPENGKGSRGVIGRARLMILKVLDSQGVGSSARAIAAVEYAVKNGARILSASWGGPVYDQALFETVKWAGEQGALFVAAAGNDAKDNDTDPHPTYPASFDLPNVISVAAYDNSDRLAPFSNYGKHRVHLGAPGVAIFSTVRGGYRWGEGTSYAAPYVSGTAALLQSFLPSLDGQALKERLLMTSEPSGYYEKERTATGGRINAYNALRDFRPPRPSVPTHWEASAVALETEHPYPNSSQKVLEVSSPGARHVRVHFARFETEGCCDKVVLRDSQGRVVTSYSGNLGEFWSADALGDKLRVEFSADYSNNAYGFAIDRYETSREEIGGPGSIPLLWNSRLSY